MKNITNMAQAINYAREANIRTVITDVDNDYYLDEYVKGKWEVIGEFGWYNTLEDVLAMEFITCEVTEEDELLIIVESTGW